MADKLLSIVIMILFGDKYKHHLVKSDGLVQERHNSSALAMELRLSRTNPLHWRHNECDGVLNHQLHNCLLNRLFRRRSKKVSMLCVTGLCEENSPVTGEFPAQRASDAENVSIWWCHHAIDMLIIFSHKWLIS